MILVNGVPWPVMQVQRRVYRFRMLNASISRSYRPTLFPGGSVHMVGTDGGMMPRSREVSWWRHGSAERYEFLVDFSQYAPGTRVELRNLSNENNRDFDNTDKIMAFDVIDEPVDTSDHTWNYIPDAMVVNEAMSLTRDMAKRTRVMEFKKKVWTTGGASTVAPGKTSSRAGSVRSWPTPTSATSRSGSSTTPAAAGSTRCTPTWSTSRS